MAAHCGGSTINGAQDVPPNMEFRQREPCAHADLEDLGWGGRTHYFRCLGCGLPVMRTDGSLWILRSATPA